MRQERFENVKYVGTRWIDINKGDSDRLEYRSRLVAQEVRHTTTSDFFSGTAPLQGLKFLLLMSLCEWLPDLNGKLLRKLEEELVSVIDVKRAHFCAKARREVKVRLPPELDPKGEFYGLLLQSLYGTQDAAANWEFAYTEVLLKLGFCQGASSPCVFHHVRRGIRTWVHGEGFVNSGTKSNLLWFHAELQKVWTLTIRGTLGPPSRNDPDCIQKIRILGRLVERTNFGFLWEADPRHSELIVQQVGVSGTAVETPTVGVKKEDYDDAKMLNAKDAALYRSVVMRASYLVTDRPDLQYCPKELAKTMSKPTTVCWGRLKRLARHLKRYPRVVQRLDAQTSVNTLDGWADTDHAGCVLSRKSTSCSTVMFGRCMMKSQSKGQAVIALSSGKAEYYGLVSHLSVLLGLLSLGLDWGRRFKLTAKMDATAGIAIGKRRGLGRVKHIATNFLWVQKKHEHLP